MLRLQFLFDLLIPMQRDGRMTQELFQDVLSKASLWGQRNGATGLTVMEQELATSGIMEPPEFRAMVRRAVPLSDTIRYAQMGHPETILIGSLTDLPVEHQTAFAEVRDQVSPTWSGDDWSPDIAVDLGELMSGMPRSSEGDIVRIGDSSNASPR